MTKSSRGFFASICLKRRFSLSLAGFRVKLFWYRHSIYFALNPINELFEVYE